MNEEKPLHRVLGAIIGGAITFALWIYACCCGVLELLQHTRREKHVALD